MLVSARFRNPAKMLNYNNAEVEAYVSAQSRVCPPRYELVMAGDLSPIYIAAGEICDRRFSALHDGINTLFIGLL